MSATNHFTVRMVGVEDWQLIRWLWQAYRNDLAGIVRGLPYADGRYQAERVDRLPDPDTAGYLAWRAHPSTCEDAPIAFALVDGVSGQTHRISAFWVAPAARRDRVGHQFAMQILDRHPRRWEVSFQHDNIVAATFWRRVAADAFSRDSWTEERVPVRDRPLAPPDHRIRTR